MRAHVGSEVAGRACSAAVCVFSVVRIEAECVVFVVVVVVLSVNKLRGANKL